MTNTTNIIRTTTRTVATTIAAAALSLSITCAAQAQIRTHVIGNAMQQPTTKILKSRTRAVPNKRAAFRMPQNKRAGFRMPQKKRAGFRKGFSNSTKELLKAKARAANKVRTAKKVPLKGILKRPGAAKVNKHVKFNMKPLGKGKKYRAKHLKTKNVRFPGKSGKTFKNAKNLRNGNKAAKLAKTARTANTVRKASKAAKFAKVAAAGTGVGAVVAVGASLAGVDPVEMAALKASNPAEYNRRMRDLKKNPVKYMGKNIANNTKKAAQNVGNATKKAGCGIGNVFKKKGKKKQC